MLQEVEDESKRIWRYAFMEMMNNAIEHSGCNTIYCRVVTDALYTEITITDDGIGIFKNVQNYLQIKTENYNRFLREMTLLNTYQKKDFMPLNRQCSV